MSDTWIEQAINETLATLNPQTLLIEAAKHVQVEGVWTKGKIRPSLIGDPCALAQVKKYRGHDPQPGMEIMAARAGRPNGGTAVNFIRGWLMEAIAVAALRASGRCEIGTKASSGSARPSPRRRRSGRRPFWRRITRSTPAAIAPTVASPAWASSPATTTRSGRRPNNYAPGSPYQSAWPVRPFALDLRPL